jgi:hypothetical protein
MFWPPGLLLVAAAVVAADVVVGFPTRADGAVICDSLRGPTFLTPFTPLLDVDDDDDNNNVLDSSPLRLIL